MAPVVSYNFLGVTATSTRLTSGLTVFADKSEGSHTMFPALVGDSC